MKKLLIAIAILLPILVCFAPPPIGGPISGGTGSGSGTATNLSGGSLIQVTNIVNTANQERFQNYIPPASITEWEIVSIIHERPAGYFNTVCPNIAYYPGNGPDGVLAMYIGTHTNISPTWGAVHGCFGKSLFSLEQYGPVLTPSVSGWDSVQIMHMTTRYYNGTNFVYYVGGTNVGFETRPTHIGVAWTLDGTNFTKYANNPVITTNSTTTNKNVGVAVPFMVINNSLFYLFYSGVGTGGNEQICLAVGTTPVGPFNDINGGLPIIPGYDFIGSKYTTTPSVARLKDGRWMMYHYSNVGGDFKLTYSYSLNLTNWTDAQVATVTSQLGTTPQLLDPFYFEDNGRPAMLLTDMDTPNSKVYLARPKKESINLSEIPTEVVTNNEVGVTLTGTFTGDMNGLTNANPAMATNNLTASDHQVLARFGANVYWMSTNLFTGSGGDTNIGGTILSNLVIVTGLDGCVADYNGSVLVQYSDTAWAMPGFANFNEAPVYVELGGDGLGGDGQWVLFVGDTPTLGGAYTNELIYGSNFCPCPPIIGSYPVHVDYSCNVTTPASIEYLTVEQTALYLNTAKVGTNHTGNVSINGTLTSTFTGNGAGLTNANPTNLLSSVVPTNKLPANLAPLSQNDGSFLTLISHGALPPNIWTNVDTRDRSVLGNVGIGTNSPGYPLEINKTTPTTNALIFLNANTASGTNTVVLTRFGRDNESLFELVIDDTHENAEKSFKLRRVCADCDTSGGYNTNDIIRVLHGLKEVIFPYDTVQFHAGIVVSASAAIDIVKDNTDDSEIDIAVDTHYFSDSGGNRPYWLFGAAVAYSNCPSWTAPSADSGLTNIVFDWQSNGVMYSTYVTATATNTTLRKDF